MNLGLENKIAIVTGGSEGIGKAAALSLSLEGATVIICARRPKILESTASKIRSLTNGDVLGITADVTETEQLEKLFDTVATKYGGPDILVNNAGASSAMPFEATTEQTWQMDLDLKLFGAIRCSRLALPHMKARGGGRIINITTVEGKSPGKNSVPTSVSRAAGIAFTKAMSKEYAKHNILVNTICIGLIKSAQHVRHWQSGVIRTPKLTLKQWYEREGKEIPLGRYGEPEEAGDVITFLASQRASYITGTAINLDGGASPVV